MDNVAIRPAMPTDADRWLALRLALWPEATDAEHRNEIERHFAGCARDPQAVLLAIDATGSAVGFAELSIRDYAEGCTTDRVAFLEGWYVAPEYRRRGAGRALVAAAEAWGRSQGCPEFASDTQADNEASAEAHRALGFTDAGTVRCFRKELAPSARPAPGDRIAVAPADTGAAARERADPRGSAKAPDRIETQRLVLRRPRPTDAAAIFARYASDPDVTRFVGWPRHESLADTVAFLAVSDAKWERWPAGPYLILSRADGALLGSTGLGFETPYRAATGYVLARDAWGRGYATEALDAVVGLAARYGVQRLYALCHVGHRASSHVLEKCGFEREGILRRHAELPNLAPGIPTDLACYSKTFERGGAPSGDAR